MLRSRQASFAAVVVAFTAAPGSALESWMTESEITAAFGGTTVDGHYRDKHTFTESYHGNGKLDYRDDRRRSAGHWSVTAGTFCTIYDDDPAGGCFRVHRVGSNCFEFYFVARTEADTIKPKDPLWTARAWISGQKDTCVDGPNV
jgi:hypothetical protein